MTDGIQNQDPPMANYDPEEIGRFESLASRWWDPEGEFKPLHQMNPLRMEFIADRATLKASSIIDVGCGGGILAEALAAGGARVTAIDMAAKALAVAKIHAESMQLAIDYRQQTVESMAASHPGEFDIVTCLEMIEHVPDPGSVVAACAQLLRPGGRIFFSTINRTAKAWLLAIVGAEHLLGLLPRGTHHYDKFVRPAELARWCRRADLNVLEITGMHYNPLTADFRLAAGVEVNYFLHAQKASQP